MNTKKLTTATLFTTLAMIFSYIEFLIPFNLGVPGIKLGLANVVIIITLYRMGARYAFAVNVMRVLLSGLLFCGIYGCLYGLSGALFSLSVMVAFKKCRAFSVVGVSVAGGITHNLAQIFVAALVVSNLNIFAYFPLLIFSGLLCGFLNSLLSHTILRHLPAKEVFH